MAGPFCWYNDNETPDDHHHLPPPQHKKKAKSKMLVYHMLIIPQACSKDILWHCAYSAVNTVSNSPISSERVYLSSFLVPCNKIVYRQSEQWFTGQILCIHNYKACHKCLELHASDNWQNLTLLQSENRLYTL